MIVLVMLLLSACTITGNVALECAHGTSRLCEEDACTSDSIDLACCQSPYKYCAFEGKCYEQNILNKPGYYPKGMFCFKLIHGFESTTRPRWFDCDGAEGAYCSNRSYCNFHAARSGEEHVGEYNYMGKRECCGDDPQEYYIIGGDGTVACCRAQDRVVEQGLCVAPVIKTPEPAIKTPEEEPTTVEPAPKPVRLVPESPENNGEPVPDNAEPGFFQRLANWFKGVFN